MVRPIPRRPPSGLVLPALGSTLLVQVVCSVGAGATPLLGPFLTQRWGVPTESIGYVTAMQSAGICWYLAGGSPMLAHFGPVRSLQIGLAALALGLLLMSQPALPVAMAGALLIGLGLAPNTPAGSQILMRAAPPAHRGLIFSIKQAGVPGGGALAGVVVAPLLLWLGFPGAIWLLAALMIATALSVQVVRRMLDADDRARQPDWPRMFVSPRSFTRAVRILKDSPNLGMLTAIGVSYSILQACVTGFTATYMVVRHGHGLAAAGLLMATLLAASAVARIAFGWLADRMGPRRGSLLLALLALGSSAAILLMVLAAGTGSWVVYGCMVLVGATTMGWNGIHMAELARMAPVGRVSEVTSAASLFGFVGSVCGPLVFALAVGRTGSFDWAYLGAAAQLAAFALFALWRGRAGG
jgi:MFS family permease